jgi:hypothetical protein
MRPDRLYGCGDVDAGLVPAYGAVDYVDMKSYLFWRACGRKVEIPAVRP